MTTNGVAAVDIDAAIDRLIEIDRETRQRRVRDDELSREAAELKTLVQSHFERTGTQSVQKGRTKVYLRREFWPKTLGVTGDAAGDDAARARLVAALKAHPDTSHLVGETINHQSLRSFLLNDCEKDGLGTPVVPEHLKTALGVAERFDVRVGSSG